MQDIEGKASRKSDEIAATPMREKTAEVTPRLNISEREQANAKKVRQTMKKGLENYFSTGVRVAPPSLAGTPSDAAGKRQGGEDKMPNSKEGEGRWMPTSGLKTPTVRTHTNSH